VQKGGLVVVLVWATQRHPEYLQNPHSFRPDRFLGAESERARAVLCGFGLGPRRCPGRSMAIAQACLAVGTALQSFTVDPAVPLPRPRLRITLGPQGPVTARVRWHDG
jgi:cytochrome P450